MAAEKHLHFKDDEVQFTAVNVDRKITDLVADWESKNQRPWISFEYFAPRTEQGIENLSHRFERMGKQGPLFMDMTWGAGGSTSQATTDLCLKIKQLGYVANMHLTCTNMVESMVDDALAFAARHGITNIVALRGDPPAGSQSWEATTGGYQCARDLVAHIRAKYNDFFCLTVAGYPQGHPDRIKLVTDRELTDAEKIRSTHTPEGPMVCSDEEYAIEMAYLKSKVDAGANLITTQMFFDAPLFLQFVADCRAAGITVPIIPGLMLLQTYHGFHRMTTLCKSRVPAEVFERIETIKDDEAKIREYGIEFGTQLCRDLMAGGVNGLHFYTLNIEHVTYGVLKNLGAYTE
jgi:methylenetetrahydrofolate reductase (NADPH)